MNEKNHQSLWYLDTGFNNYMSGDKSIFFDLDESYQDFVKLDNESKVFVIKKKKGKVAILTKNNIVHTIFDVFFVPELKTNLLSIGQLQEKSYKVYIKIEACRIGDNKLGLISS
jgi:hypothetical protein